MTHTAGIQCLVFLCVLLFYCPRLHIIKQRNTIIFEQKSVFILIGKHSFSVFHRFVLETCLKRLAAFS